MSSVPRVPLIVIHKEFKESITPMIYYAVYYKFYKQRKDILIGSIEVLAASIVLEVLYYIKV